MKWTVNACLCILCVIYGLTGEAEKNTSISGSVWYRERIALPPGAEIKVSLENVARMDVPADVIATTSVAAEGSSPWKFSLAYDPATLQHQGRYVVRARIESDGRLLFIGAQPIPGINEEVRQPIDILVMRTGQGILMHNDKARAPDASLTEPYWKAIEINGTEAKAGAEQLEPNLVLTANENRVRGFTGCNRLTGEWQRNGTDLSFQHLASTRRACLHGMEQEQAFLSALNRVKRFSISGNNMALYSGDERVILRFKAVALH